MTAQINATGTIAAVALDIPFQYAVYVGLVSILLCSMLGGMRGVTWTQVAQHCTNHSLPTSSILDQ